MPLVTSRAAAKQLGAKVESSLTQEVTTVVFSRAEWTKPKKGGKRELLLEKETPMYYEALLGGKWMVGYQCE